MANLAASTSSSGEMAAAAAATAETEGCAFRRRGSERKEEEAEESGADSEAPPAPANGIGAEGKKTGIEALAASIIRAINEFMSGLMLRDVTMEF